MHSCKRNLVIAASNVRGRERTNTIDSSRTARDCPHQGKHQHGTSDAYKSDRCRCRPCTDAAAADQFAHRRKVAYGRSPLVDAGPARDHVRALMNTGMSWRAISKASGVTPRVMTRLLYALTINGETSEPSKQVRKENAAALLAVTLDPTASQYRPGFTIQRRLQALVALGYSPAFLAKRLNCRTQQVNVFINGKDQITKGMFERVDDLYRHLSGHLPQAQQHLSAKQIAAAVRHAKDNDWVSPMGWSDIDDIDVTPTPGTRPSDRGDVNKVAIKQRLRGDLSSTLTVADTRHMAVTWVDRGRGLAALGTKTGVPVQDLRELLLTA